MARLVGDVDIGPAGGIAVRSEVVVLFQIRRVAARTLIVPGLVASGPMEAIAASKDLIWVKGKPALSPLILGAAVPRDAERLVAAARKCDQILLQGINTERVGDFIVVRPAIRALPAHCLGRVTTGASLGADECGGSVCLCVCFCRVETSNS